jgi:hypothetical protein
LNIAVAVHTPARALERATVCTCFVSLVITSVLIQPCHSFHSCLSSSAAESLAVRLIIFYNIAEDKTLAGFPCFFPSDIFNRFLAQVDTPTTNHS